jgi:hypothetical protein
LGRPRFSMLTLAAVMMVTAPVLSESGGSATTTPQTIKPAIVIGFVGGFVRHNNPRHGPVQLAERIRQVLPNTSHVEVFENRHRKQAYDAVLRLLDANRDGVLSEEEKSSARIILFGHSWGAAAAVMLARDLRRSGIPVLLTVQVDSVAKLWQNDSVIPDNVVEAVNFHQPHGMVHGRAQITAADPAKTQILGNYLVDYKKNPVTCSGPSWYDQLFTPGHAKSECDPHIWSQIEAMMKQRLAQEPTAVAANPKP